jgi:hypothetical protein
MEVSAMRTLVIFVLFVLFPGPACLFPQTAAIRSPATGAESVHELAKLRPGHWAALGTNTLYDVRYVPEPGGHHIRTIMTGWSGAAFNTDLNQLWVHGGGHGDGADNAVYAFDVDTLTWHRLFDPSTVVTGHTGRYYLDGKPAAVHSYDYLEYVPALGRMLVVGARGPYPGVSAHTTVDMVGVDGVWLRLPDVPSCEHPSAAVHPETGVLWQHGGEGAGFLSSYDFSSGGLWNAHGQWITDNIPGPYRTTAIDPVHELFVMLNTGDDNVWVWDISGGHNAGTIEGEVLPMWGATQILQSDAPPGLAWNTRTERLYAWFGGVDVYVLDLGAQMIAKVPVAPGNKVVPTPGTANGVYGRWRYVEKYDVFMGVNSVDEPVFFFRLP